MKKFLFLFLIILLPLETVFAQRKPRPRVPRNNNLAAKTVVKEKDALEAAIALQDKAERVNALRKFTADYPKTKEKTRVAELLVSTLAALADEKMQAGETENGIEFFKVAVAEAPTPISDKLFTEVLAQIPNSLFMRGQTAAAIETARKVEEKTDGNAKQTLALAGFYLGLENAAEAKRLVEKSLAIEPEMPAAYQTLGLAERLNFNLEDSVKAYEKALELAPDSTVSKRSLAEMKRAVGKPSEAVALYREILAKDETDNAARTGLILALFDEENRAEAETEMGKSLEANPNNLPLLVGAAYWYAAHNDGAKAVETAEKAVRVEPRYTWAHIALARGLMMQKRLAEAEKTLLSARQYGNFPTLEYELANVRMQTGFYREAAEGLAKNFTIKDGAIETKLGGRVSRDGKNFIELLSAERKASIFEPTAADNPETAEKLKLLLDFYQKLNANPNDELIAAKADEFVKGDDKMKMHRQLFTAGMLLNKKSNLTKVLDLTKSAVGNLEMGLSIENPAAAVLADELYNSRQIANSRGEIILVPEVSRQTLSNILRGRIEDLSGWALYHSGKTADAAVRLKRAVSILPAKSSWWRDSQWRLGTALETDDKLKDALEAYIKSYTSGEPDAVKYSVVQSVYQRVNGSTDGLESKIGEKPASLTAEISAKTETTAQTNEPETPKTEPPPNAETTSNPEQNNESIAVNSKSIPPSPIAVKSPSETAPTETKTEEIKPEETKAIETLTETPKTEESAPKEIKKEESVPTTENNLTKEPETQQTKTEMTETAPTENKTAPVETETSVTKIETEKPQTTSDSSKIEKTESETAVQNQKNQTSPIEPPQKSIFDPIIITVPKAEIRPLKTSTAENGQIRPRIAAAAATEKTESIVPCRLLANQEKASILSDGGNLALIIELIGDGDLADVKAVSSSPEDVEAEFDSEIGGQNKRALFVVKSLSQKKGIFTVTFELPCGKKEVSVTVR